MNTLNPVPGGFVVLETGTSAGPSNHVGGSQNPLNNLTVPPAKWSAVTPRRPSQGNPGPGGATEQNGGGEYNREADSVVSSMLRKHSNLGSKGEVCVAAGCLPISCLRAWCASTYMEI
jgi:hypothetical protein